MKFTHNNVSPWQALALLAAAQFLVMFDGAVVNVALPSIQRDLGFSAASLQWVYSAYALAFGGLLLLGGRIADIIGRRRMFVIGAGVLTLASLLAGAAQSQATLLVARGTQGVGAAIVTPAALSIILGLFPDGSDRNRALGVWGAIIGLAAASGTLLGGVITQGPGWRWVFFVTVPLAVAVSFLGRPVLPESRADGTRRSVDAPGAITITAGLILIVFAIVQGPDTGWFAARTLVPLTLGFGFVAAFVGIELRTQMPIVRLSIFRLGTVAATNSVAFIFGGAQTGTIFLLTLFMQNALGYSPLQTGLAYLPLTGGILIASTIAARIVTLCGVKLMLLIGTVAAGVAIYVLSLASAASTYAGLLLPSFILLAVGVGSVGVTLSIAAFAGVGDGDFGVASGLFNTSTAIGSALGVAVLSTVAYTHIRNAAPTAGASGMTEVFGSAYAAAFGVGLVFVGLALVIALTRIRQADVSTWRCAVPYRMSAPRAGFAPGATPLREI